MKQLIYRIVFIVGSISLLFPQNGYTQPGYLDLTFNGTGMISSVNPAGCNTTTVQQDKKVITAGLFGNPLMERYNEDGSLDESFGVMGHLVLQYGQVLGDPKAIAETTNHRILFASWYLPVSPENFDIILMALKPDGSLDSTFGNGITKNGVATLDIKSNDRTNAMVIQPDGKILVSGETSNNDAVSYWPFVARFNPDGTLDSSFGENGVALYTFDKAILAPALAINNDGKIFVGGTYGLFNATPLYYVLCFQPDGQIDNNFGENGLATYRFGPDKGEVDWANELKAIAVQPDGKIIGGGQQGDYNDFIYDMGLVRFNTDGSLDETYGDSGAVTMSYPGHFSVINTLLMQPDGKLIAGATAQDNVVGTDPMLLLRFLDDGTLDPSFAVNGMQVTTNGNYSIACKAGFLEEDGKIIIGGYSNQRLLTARFNGDNVLATNFKDLKAVQEQNTITLSWQTLHENNTASFTVQRSGNAASFTDLATVPAQGGTGAHVYSYIDNHPLSGTNYYRIRENAGNGSHSFSAIVKIEMETAGSIGLYPNPARKLVTITGLRKDNPVQVRVRDMQGRLVLQKDFAAGSTIQLDLQTLAPGAYYIHVNQDGKNSHLKLLKE